MYYYNNGDDMKLNLVVPIICSLLLGYLCASFIFNQYGINTFAFSEKNNIYFLQCGSYATYDASLTEIDGIEDKITIKEDNKYYSYIGMTTSNTVAENIKKMYSDKDIEIYIKEGYIDNDTFINQLSQYDILLENSNNIEEVNSVLKTILATYNEIFEN